MGASAVPAATAASASLGRELGAGVVVAPVPARRRGRNGRPGMRRLAVDLDAAREHEARDARPHGGTREAQRGLDVRAAVRRGRIGRRLDHHVRAPGEMDDRRGACDQRIELARRSRPRGRRRPGAARAARRRDRRRTTARKGRPVACQCAHSARPMKPPAPVTTTGRAPSPGRSEPAPAMLAVEPEAAPHEQEDVVEALARGAAPVVDGAKPGSARGPRHPVRAARSSRSPRNRGRSSGRSRR